MGLRKRTLPNIATMLAPAKLQWKGNISCLSATSKKVAKVAVSFFHKDFWQETVKLLQWSILKFKLGIKYINQL